MFQAASTMVDIEYAMVIVCEWTDFCITWFIQLWKYHIKLVKMQ